jgi:hypothetical protein
VPPLCAPSFPITVVVVVDQNNEAIYVTVTAQEKIWH